MKNRQIAKIFFEIADILETQEVQWKPAAYRKAAITIESLSEDIEEIAKRNELKQLPGIGENIARKIEEIIETGTLKYYEKLRKEFPVDFGKLTSIPGLGPRKVKKLYKTLGIKNISDLKKALKKHKIRKLEGFGEKSEEVISKGIELLEKTKGRALLGFALTDAMALINKLEKHTSVGRISIAGSTRRMKETIGDIDILITSDKPAEVMDLFTSLPSVERVLMKGPTKTSVRLRIGLNCDLRVLKDESFGSALQYFTGSKAHNIHLRRIAISKGLKLSEYGVFRKKKKIAGKTEEEVYRALGLPYIPPELREDAGEIEAAEKRSLPKLVKRADIKGDLHTHTKWSDGSHTIEEMALAAREMGHEYINITDHSKGLGVARGLDEKQLSKQLKEIDKLKLGGITILKGTEVDILKDGTLDLGNSALKQLDVVIAAVHSNFNMDRKEMTKRIERAMENGHMDILAHPTGRLIGRREGYKIDLDAIFQKAKETNTAIEINAWPERLDIRDIYVRQAVERGVLLSIGTDAHAMDQLRFMDIGAGTARRGWARKRDVINTRSAKELKRLFGEG